MLAAKRIGNMASTKGNVRPAEWRKHMRPFGKRQHNKKVRQKGKKDVRVQE